jgi:hypothetical protein
MSDDDNLPIPFTVVGGREPLTEDEAEALISHLASLSALEYEQKREGAAAKLKVRLGVLDRMVKAEQGRQQKEEHGPQLERRPWATAVNGGELINELIGDLTRYVSLEPDYAGVVSFWSLHTYLVNQTFITPRLAITAPQPRCGKTTLVNWLQTVVQRPLSSVNVSAAAVYHVVERLQPTLLIDEADTFLATQNELRGVLNSGHQKNGFVHRWDPQAKCIRSYPTFCACAISLIGTLPPTLQDRSVRVRLRRRRPDEKIASLRTDQMNDEIARRCARWALDNQYVYEAADPAIPEQLFNRVEDNWRPLLAVADVIGGEWPTRLREIAVKIAELEAGEDPSTDTQLLRDIQDVFAGRPWITTNDLLTGLELREYAMSGKRLANKLKPYDIEPKQERRGAHVERGYLVKDFADAFARYLDVPLVPFVPDAGDARAEPQEATGTNGTSGTAENRVKVYRRY